MAKQFSPDADDQSSEKKSSQQRLLLLLLLLIGLFAYLYFFTGLIRPRPEQGAEAPPPPAAQPAPEVVKQPLPPRPEAPATAEAPASVEATAGKPAAAPAGKPAEKTPAEKPATPAAKPAPAAAPAKPAATAKAEKPAAPAAPAKEAAKPAPAKPQVAAKEAKPAAPAKEAKATAPAKEAKAAAGAKEAKPAAQPKERVAAAKEAKPAAKSAKAQAKGAAGGYALEINEDIAVSEVSSVSAKLKKAGITNVVQTKAQKGESMHRLFLADFGDRSEAAEELERLKQVAPNAFMLKENNRYAVYAGSFMRQGKAAVEQDRLYDKGVRLVLKEATIPVPVVKLRAGNFPDPASAEKAAVGLKKSGLTAHVVKVGK